MEASHLNTKSNFHARSNSLPSRPHPLIQQCNDHLERLSASQETSTSSSSLLIHKLKGLQDLHECVENLVQLPLTKEALLHEPQEVLLDGSLRLLDVCTTTKDSLLHTKECIRELQSIMRRRKGGEVELRAEAKKFLASRKVVRKAISKALSNLKVTTKSCNKTLALVGLLENVEEVTLSTFQSWLQFISGTTTQSKSSKWILISKVMQNKKVACTKLEDESEFAQVDEALQSYILSQRSKIEDMSMMQNQLEKLESLIQDLEEGIEFMFRRLIKIRVSLLNILNH